MWYIPAELISEHRIQHSVLLRHLTGYGLPYYKKVNDWIHQNTDWKTFKHSCGAVELLMSHFIESGFDIINPVQINA